MKTRFQAIRLTRQANHTKWCGLDFSRMNDAASKAVTSITGTPSQWEFIPESMGPTKGS